MRTIKLYYINIFLIITAGLLLIVNLTIRFVNKEQDKIMWYAAINSSIEKDTLKNTNLIIMIDAKLINNFNQSIKGLDYDSVNETDGILSTKNQNKVVLALTKKNFCLIL